MSAPAKPKKKPTPKPMPAQRRAILGFIIAFIAEHSWPPTRREIAEGCGLGSTSTVQYHLAKLAISGHITLAEEREARGIAIVKKEEA